MLKPTDVCTSTRLMGLELEYDAGSLDFTGPDRIQGWARQRDGSLSNGFEYITNPVVPMVQLATRIAAFTHAFKDIKISLANRGGYHVHVQAHDLTAAQAAQVANVYQAFQPIINNLVAESRRDNRFCRVRLDRVEASEVQAIINRQLSDRASARFSDERYYVTNLSMMACANPEDRSIEFRQGSISKRYSCIFGWAVFCHAIVEIARQHMIDNLDFTTSNADFSVDRLKQLCERAMTPHGAGWIGTWIQWRLDEMRPVATEEDVAKLVTFMSTRRVAGLVTIATGLDWCYPKIKVVAAKAADDRRLIVGLSSHTNRFQVKPVQDFDAIVTAMESAYATRQVTPPSPPTPQPSVPAEVLTPDV